jgi:hypothetical protein
LFDTQSNLFADASDALQSVAPLTGNATKENGHSGTWQAAVTSFIRKTKMLKGTKCNAKTRDGGR